MNTEPLLGQSTQRSGSRAASGAQPSNKHLASRPVEHDQKMYLVRHGEVLNPDHIVYADLDGYGLSELGRAQVVATAQRLPAGAVIVASPLQRAVETAGILGAVLGSDFETDDDLTEWHLGRRWAGHTWESLDIAFPGELDAYLQHPSTLPFSPESLSALADRVSGFIRRLRARRNGPLVVVSHQDPIQAARLALTGRPLDDLQVDKPGHAAIVTLEVSSGGPWRELELWAPRQGERFPPI
jgi:broad specificity phosphatase PhoE